VAASLSDAGWINPRRRKVSASSFLALGSTPLLLLLDEPTLHLDIAAQIGLLDSLAAARGRESLHRRRRTHDLNLAAEYADYRLTAARRCLRVGLAQHLST